MQEDDQRRVALSALSRRQIQLGTVPLSNGSSVNRVSMEERFTIMCHLIEKVMLMERDLEAFQSRDRKMLLELILAYPATRTIEQAQALLDDTLALPMNAEMAAWYR